MPELRVAIRSRGVLLKILLRGLRNLDGEEESCCPLLPASGPLLAYVDTGASDTVLDMGLIESLSLQPTGSAALHVLGRAGVSFHETYAVELALAVPGEEPNWQPLTVLSGPVYQTGAVVALGRDYLRRLVFTYDGPARQVRFQWRLAETRTGPCPQV